MKIFPAIDIKDKKCVRLLKGDFKNQTVYDVSPLDQAQKYNNSGFSYLHIVDLDGALTGDTVNLNTIEEIISKTNIKVEVGGGIRSLEKIKKYLDVGADKIILGSAAIKDKVFLKNVCNKFTNKIVLGLDAKKGFLAISGWKEYTNLKATEYLNQINDFGISRLIYTDIERDGTKSSPNLEETLKLSKISNSPVIISGGVSSINDIKKIKSMKENNIEGVIVGKAIYDGDIDLKELSSYQN